MLHASNYRVRPFEQYVRSHAVHLAYMYEPFGVYLLRYDAYAVRYGHKAHELRLHIRRKTRIRERRYVERAYLSYVTRPQAVRRLPDIQAGLGKFVYQRKKMFRKQDEILGYLWKEENLSKVLMPR